MTVSTEGDFGDACYVLGILSALGGEHTLLLQRSDKTKIRDENALTTFFNMLAPLAESQNYIKVCRKIAPEDKVDWPSAKFRQQGHYSIGESLMQAHLKHLIATLGIGQGITGKQKWLTAVPDKRSKGKIIINRTGRYRNPHFDWKPIVKHYSHRLIFLGQVHEWREFISHHGYVDFQPTTNLLEVAQLIAGSELFIGNQSCAFAIAEGLKHPRILEVSLEFPDTIFGGDNVQYVVDGTMTLPDIDGSGVLKFQSGAYSLSNVETRYIPPGGWIFETPDIGRIVGGMVTTCARDVRRRLNNGITQEEAEVLVLKQNLERCPAHFSRYMQVPSFSRPKAALKAAGVTNHPILNPDPIALVR